MGASLQSLLARGSPFLFATHLHELTALPELAPLLTTEEGATGAEHNNPRKKRKIQICHLRVRYDASTGILVYDRKLCPRQGPTVYGLEVCKALDMDPEFIDAAHRIRRGVLGLPESLISRGPGGGSGSGSAVVARSSRYNAKVVVDTCAICSMESAEEVHHIHHQAVADADGYIGFYHKYAAFNLLPLCRSCHDKVHSGALHVEGYVQTSKGVVLASETTHQTREIETTK